MTTLDSLGLKHKTDKASSHHDYLRLYEHYFKRMAGNPIALLEVGVQFGNSIKVWLDYFPQASIAGVDLVPCDVKDNRFVMTQGDAADRAFWNQFNPFMKPWDIVIDDASHNGNQQRITFEMLWPKVAPMGFYIIEDVFTWWDNYFNAGNEGTGLVGGLIRDLNWAGKLYHGKPVQPAELPKLNLFEETMAFIHCFRGLVIIGKK